MSQLCIEEICGLAPVIPVLVIDDAATAVPLAEALVAGGLRALEVTLRTPVALEAIHAMAKAVPEATVGVGTLLTADDVQASVDAGAKFGVSPGFSHAVIDAADSAGLPMLPGVATPSEAMAASERGLTILKFFPAEANGGAPVLKAWASPLAEIKFCPTGGIGIDTAPKYLSLANVLCVGGSWVAPKAAVDSRDWDIVTRLSREASTLRRGPIAQTV